MGREPGQGALLQEIDARDHAEDRAGSQEERADVPLIDDLVPSIDDLAPSASDPDEAAAEPPVGAHPVPRRSKNLPTLLPDPSPDGVRSRFDPDEGVVYYNDRHPDYLLLKADEQALLNYLATLVAKEYVVYNNPRAASDELAEEMVRMLIRVRRHLPRVR
jgi:hypothetical protein